MKLLNVTRYRFLCPLFILVLSSCTKPRDTLFTQLATSETGIDFVNSVIDSDSLSIIDYLYYYNGAGVAVADINN
ncbi:MAG: hypothetical protein ABIO76_09165, partial [Ginsengibacter sp.]